MYDNADDDGDDDDDDGDDDEDENENVADDDVEDDNVAEDEVEGDDVARMMLRKMRWRMMMWLSGWWTHATKKRNGPPVHANTLFIALVMGNVRAILTPSCWMCPSLHPSSFPQKKLAKLIRMMNPYLRPQSKNNNI